MSTFQIVLLVCFSLILIILISRIIQGKWYFTSYYSEEREYNIDEDSLKNNLIMALKKSNFKRIIQQEDSFHALTLPTMSSFSERIAIEFREIAETKYVLKFNSKCLFPLQIFDYGKNKRNSKRLFKNLEVAISE